MVRPSWDDTWLQVAHVIARRSLCIRSHAGCVLVTRTNRVVSTGYNGPPHGLPVNGTCDQWCPRARTEGSLSYDDDLATHAEMNAVIMADRSLLEGGAAYVTRMPCFMCAKMLANSGIRRLVYMRSVDDIQRKPERSQEFLERCGIKVEEASWVSMG